MADCYAPLLEEFVLEAEEIAAVEAAMKTADPWGWTGPDKAQKDAFKSAKDKIRAFHMKRHNDLCCYCRTILHGGGSFMTDREHVLPKSSPNYKPYTFTMWNLGVACKRCNMQFKGADDDFVVNKTDPNQYQESSNYLLVHPNFDNWKEHLKRVVIQDTDLYLVKYTCLESDKSHFTYDYFDLRGLEENTFDNAQREAPVEEESELMGSIRMLAREYGQ